MKRCPMCGHDQFITAGHVVQKWLVDDCGLCIEVLDDCICVTHEANDDDIWECAKCGYACAGKCFNVEE